jgi:hypothetical protein
MPIAYRIKTDEQSLRFQHASHHLLAAHFKLNQTHMKTKNIALAMMGFSSLVTLTLSAAPLISIQVPAPAVTVQVPAPVVPAVTVETTVPDTYAWDGSEYVGMVGSQYFYLGAGNVWMPLDTIRIARWHDWQRIHADWRTHMVRNDLYRRDVHGHTVPLRDDHARDINHDHDNGLDKSHDHDH